MNRIIDWQGVTPHLRTRQRSLGQQCLAAVNVRGAHAQECDSVINWSAVMGSWAEVENGAIAERVLDLNSTKVSGLQMNLRPIMYQRAMNAGMNGAFYLIGGKSIPGSRDQVRVIPVFGDRDFPERRRMLPI